MILKQTWNIDDIFQNGFTSCICDHLQNLREESLRQLLKSQIFLCISLHRSRLMWKELVVGFGCLTSQQHASVSQEQICSDKSTCCHTETEFADQTFYLTQSQYADSELTQRWSYNARQGIHWSANFEVTGMTRPGKKLKVQAGVKPRVFHSWGRCLNH